jgi:hypothetical protein
VKGFVWEWLPMHLGFDASLAKIRIRFRAGINGESFYGLVSN